MSATPYAEKTYRSSLAAQGCVGADGAGEVDPARAYLYAAHLVGAETAGSACGMFARPSRTQATYSSREARSMMSSDSRPPIERFSDDTTIRLSCREADFLLWFRCQDVFGSNDGALTILDAWVMRSGDFVTITNRLDDLPFWFELHPTEATGAAMGMIGAKLRGGWQPQEPMDSPNLWRVRAGDRIAWVRPNPHPSAKEAALPKLLEFNENALAVGESIRRDFSPMDFMDVGEDFESPATQKAGRFALETVRALGIPRKLAIEWGIG